PPPGPGSQVDVLDDYAVQPDPAVRPDPGLLTLVLSRDESAQIGQREHRDPEEHQPLGENRGAGPCQDGCGGSSYGKGEEEEPGGEDLTDAHHDGENGPQPSSTIALPVASSFF